MSWAAAKPTQSYQSGTALTPISSTTPASLDAASHSRIARTEAVGIVFPLHKSSISQKLLLSRL